MILDAEVMYFHNLDRATFFRIDDEDQLILYFDEDRFAYFTEK